MSTRQAIEARMRARRAPHLDDGPLSRMCFDARCAEGCGLAGCTCGCHHPQCPRCGSRFVQLLWVAMESWDCDSWACHHCDNRWTR